ncbi:hypothetical protein [Streptomyces sp. 4F14]|uniref:hypothetical protein n=1 Tax=Streptomyces sp. 4F14 TaxID=3394380 RepID=UPI003A893751
MTPSASAPATRVDNTVGALVVQNQWDPQAPLASGRDHAVYAFPGAPACVTRAVDACLTDGHLPTTDVTCGS